MSSWPESSAGACHRGRVWAAGLAVLLLAGAGAAPGCHGRRFTRENYETLYVGQPAWAIERKLGEPDRRGEGVWYYEREKPYYQRAEVHFDNGKATRFEWSYDRPEEAPPAGG